MVLLQTAINTVYLIYLGPYLVLASAGLVGYALLDYMRRASIGRFAFFSFLGVGLDVVTIATMSSVPISITCDTSGVCNLSNFVYNPFVHTVGTALLIMYAIVIAAVLVYHVAMNY